MVNFSTPLEIAVVIHRLAIYNIHKGISEYITADLMMEPGPLLQNSVQEALIHIKF